MIEFDSNYFKELKFSKRQIDKFVSSAMKDLDIAENSEFPEVKFQFSYSSLVKLGIALIACYNYKVSSRAGHHQKILEKMSMILKKKDIFVHGDKMRKVRNKDLYDGGIIITIKQAEEYFYFSQDIYKLTQEFIKNYFNILF